MWALSPPPCGLLHHLWVGCSISVRLFSTTNAWVLSTHFYCGLFTNFLEIPKSKPQHLIQSIYLTFCLLNQTCNPVLLELVRAKPANELNHRLLFGVGRHPISQSPVFSSLVIYWETNPPPSLTGSSVSVSLGLGGSCFHFWRTSLTIPKVYGWVHWLTRDLRFPLSAHYQHLGRICDDGMGGWRHQKFFFRGVFAASVGTSKFGIADLRIPLVSCLFALVFPRLGLSGFRLWAFFYLACLPLCLLPFRLWAV